ncbi:MAG: CvpA family protein [Bacteroidaceae bacterium]|nr:CvpA family protein [Bacteroidaceae bacterium]
MDFIQELGKYTEMIPLNITEIVALGLLLYGAIKGLINGFLKELASMTGFFIGLFLAWKYYEQIGGGALAFIGIWILTPIVLGLLASLATKLLDWSLVGGVANRLLGCILGITKWAVLIVCVLIMVGQVETIDKYVDSDSVPGINYIEEKWKTLRESL